MVDADYKITYVDIGCQGRISDGGIFKNCELYKLLASNQANIPPPSPVNNLSDLNDSFYSNIIAKQTSFMLSLPMMHFLSPLIQWNPIVRKTFRIVEEYLRRTSGNAFEILSNRFRVLSTRTRLKLEIASKVAMTCCLLHNLLRVRSKDTYTPRFC